MTRFRVYVEGKGPRRCDYMIVGEAPGREEIDRGKPFVGHAGKQLEEALERVQLGRRRQITRGSIYITNAFKGDVGDGNRNPRVAELEDHQQLLLDEICSVRPKIILALGCIPTRRLLPKAFREAGNRLGPPAGQGWESALIGRVCVLELGGQGVEPAHAARVIPCYHPAARIGKEKRAVADDAFRRFLDYPGQWD